MEKEDEWVQRQSYGSLWILSALKSLQIEWYYCWQAVCKVPVHYTQLQQSQPCMASEWRQSSTLGFHRVSNKKQTYYPPRKYRVQNESALGQQSISGKIVSLILCVWKSSYVKSSHKYPILHDSQLCNIQSFTKSTFYRENWIPHVKPFSIDNIGTWNLVTSPANTTIPFNIKRNLMLTTNQN